MPLSSKRLQSKQTTHTKKQGLNTQKDQIQHFSILYVSHLQNENEVLLLLNCIRIV